MNALPHVTSVATIESLNENVLEDNFAKETNLYLIQPNKSTALVEVDQVKRLERELRSLQSELARLTSLINQKDILIQNFRIREQELKTSLLQTR